MSMFLRAAAVGAALFSAVWLSGCLDADPIGPGGSGAALSVHVSVLIDQSSGKQATADSIEIILYDVTDDLYTETPEDLPEAARVSSFSYHNDETGSYYLAELRIDLIESVDFRVVTKLSYDGGNGRVNLEGRRSVTLSPGERKSLGMVLTEPGSPGSEEYGLAVAKSIARPGASDHGIPIVLKNGRPLGGLQFQLNFDGDAVESVTGIEVDPSSRLYSENGSLIGSSYAPADSMVRFLTVDLHGDSIPDQFSLIPAGNDLLFFVRVDIKSSFTALPDTIHLTLDDVVFSTPPLIDQIDTTDVPPDTSWTTEAIEVAGDDLISGILVISE